MAVMAPDQSNVRLVRDLPPITPESREIVKRAYTRRIATMGDMGLLRQRYDEVMRWINPPWDAVSQRLDPRSSATAARDGRPVLHVDLVGQVVKRWAALQGGSPIIFRVKPKPTPAPIPNKDPERTVQDRTTYDIDRAIAQNQSTQMEELTADWSEFSDFQRTWLWSSWCQHAFGKAIIRTGWDEVEGVPTAELFENPSQVYYAWTKRYGKRRIAWSIILDSMNPAEANRRFDLKLPVDEYGAVDMGSWLASQDESDMDQRPEQQQELQTNLYVEEYWELVDKVPDGRSFQGRDISGKRGVMYALIVAGRVIEGPYYYPWSRVPVHVLEAEHIPTWLHGKSTAEHSIPINEAYDRLLDRQDQVIEFESGPRYIGMNMVNNGDEVDIPAPFELLPLREGQDIKQLDTRVDFFPGQVQANEIREALYRQSGLTPIAWGMSANAQTSGRAMTAEWRAVELPLAMALINTAPEIKAIFESWWEYGEAFSVDVRDISYGKGDQAQPKPYRRFQVDFVPLDIRDRNEKSSDGINRYNANLLDPETAIEEMGYENTDEIIAKIRSYLVDPVWNPLRYQQLLTLQQLELSIQQQQLQLQQQQAQQAQADQAAQAQQQGAQAAAVGAQQPGAPLNESQNQPGLAPGQGILPMQSSAMSQNARGEGGMTDRVVIPLGGAGGGLGGGVPVPPPTAGQAPR